ncbi:MAG: hypothetical protein M1822_000413 [Bathelium mastoideum]|nr:MAG: hypothetical protein M1822_000413 [Bathelium mastoideum]
MSQYYAFLPSLSSANESPGPSSSNGGGGGPNVGAIAGGVVGGVVFIALLTFLVWKFIIKPRRDQYDDNWQEEEYEQEPKPGEENDAANNFTMQRDARASTHTVGSIASTVFTRASNVIQIAYIPGITNRGLESPGVLVPPVPPIPAMGSPAHSPYASQRADTESESHYFMPSDLRGSTYSADSDSRSAHHQRQSITPSLARTSMASTVYRNNAIISPVPAQSAVRGKAAVVSVKSGSSSGDNTPAITSPPVPSLDYARIGKPLQVQIPSSADKAGPSPQDSLKSTGTATYGKPIALNLTKMKSKQKSGNSTPDVSSISDADTIKAGPSGNQQLGHIINAAALKDNASTSSRPHSRAQQVAAQPSTFDDTTDDDDEDEHARSRRSLIGGNRLRTSEVTEIADTPALTHSSNTASPDSPFADQTSSLLPTVAERDERRRSTLSGINAVIEEATRRASRQPTHMGLGSDKRNESPFDDANATDDN